MTAHNISDLLAEFGAKPFTLADFQRERVELEQHFLAEHGIRSEDIDGVVRRCDLPCTNPLVEDWVALGGTGALRWRTPWVR